MATKRSGSKFLKGALMGATLGVALGIFSVSKTGKKMGRDIQKPSREFYKHLIPQLKRVKKIGEKEYRALASSAMKRYAKGKKLAEREARMILKKAHSSWKEFEKHLR